MMNVRNESTRNHKCLKSARLGVFEVCYTVDLLGDRFLIRYIQGEILVMCSLVTFIFLL